MHTHSEVVSIVNEVIETLNEREEGYLRAADHVKEADVETILREYAAQSKNFKSELMQFSDSSAEEIGKGPLGTIHQGWMNVKEKLTGYNTNSILGDCISGEEAAIKVYENTVKDLEIPSDLKLTLSGQLADITFAQDKLKVLKEDFE